MKTSGRTNERSRPIPGPARKKAVKKVARTVKTGGLKILAEYPQWVCYGCAIPVATRYPDGVATWHDGVCDVCQMERSVTEPRDFGYPRFDLR